MNRRDAIAILWGLAAASLPARAQEQAVVPAIAIPPHEHVFHGTGLGLHYHSDMPRAMGAAAPYSDFMPVEICACGAMRIPPAEASRRVAEITKDRQ